MKYLNKLIGIKRIIPAFVIILTLSSCSKFLNVDSKTALSGNNFWKTQKDVEQFTNGLYRQLRNVTMVDKPYFVFSGELRNGIWQLANNRNIYNKNTMSYFAKNDLKSLFAAGAGSGMDNWDAFYALIADANIMHENVQGMNLNSTVINEYVAEARFLRCLSYYMLVKLYGDVPYNIEAFNSDRLFRISQVTVMNNCIEDLLPVINYLPLSVSTGNTTNARATRGAALDLVMNMCMWTVCFDQTNANRYYQLTDSLGSELMNNTANAYSLQPLNSIEDSKALFLGNTNETLFLIPQNALNSADQFSWLAQFQNLVLAGINLTPTSSTTVSVLFPSGKMLTEQFFPSSLGNDNRYNIWFGSNTDADLNGTSGKFQFLKFANINQQSGGTLDSKMFFRLPDAILLRAEALNKLGKVSEAVNLVNLVRARAGASLVSFSGGGGGEGGSSNSDLDDFIYNERCREFVGEGNYFYDLVRTKRILNSNFTLQTMSSDAFKQGAWTWPINISAQSSNPNIVLNTYWLN